MKLFSIKTLFILILIIGISKQVTAQIVKAEVLATGLTCSMCSNAINKQFKKLVEVDSVSTDLNTNTFIVYFKKGNAIAPKVLKESVEKAGFFVGSMVLTMSFDALITGENTILEKENYTLIFVDAKTQTLQGETKVKILDKGYVLQKEFKKQQKAFTKYTTYDTSNENDYHLKIVSK